MANRAERRAACCFSASPLLGLLGGGGPPIDCSTAALDHHPTRPPWWVVGRARDGTRAVLAFSPCPTYTFKLRLGSGLHNSSLSQSLGSGASGVTYMGNIAEALAVDGCGCTKAGWQRGCNQMYVGHRQKHYQEAEPFRRVSWP